MNVIINECRPQTSVRESCCIKINKVGLIIWLGACHELKKKNSKWNENNNAQLAMVDVSAMSRIE